MENETNENCNRVLFAQLVLPTFVWAYKYIDKTTGNREDADNGEAANNRKEAIIQQVYDKFLERTKAPERKQILEKCRDLFKGDKFISIIDEERNKLKINDDEREPSDKELSESILERCSEQILGDGKRKYNMRDINSPGMTSNVMFTEIEDKNPFMQIDKHGNMLTILRTGVLTYDTEGMEQKFIYQYLISFNGTSHEKIFTQIDFTELAENNDYYQAFITELLSNSNIDVALASGYGGYIGSIVNTIVFPPRLQVGEEKEFSGFYRYQIDKDHAIEYDSELMAATTAYLEKEKNERISKRQAQTPKNDNELVQ